MKYRNWYGYDIFVQTIPAANVSSYSLLLIVAIFVHLSSVS